MIELKKENVHKIVDSEEKAEQLIRQGFVKVEPLEKDTKKVSVKRGESTDN
jgi:hypothetical protein